MQTSRDVIPRKASRMVEEALADTRVITVNGARQAGKSTLARLAAAVRPGSVVRLLDDSATLRSATDDPAGFVEHDGLLVIDEVQLAPELFRSIKVAVDTDPRPGQFLLTGSAQVLALRALPDALPGRMEIIELWPFSQGELRRSPDGFVDAAFAHGAALTRTSPLRKRDYLEAVVRGGFPEAVRRAPPRRAAFLLGRPGTPDAPSGPQSSPSSTPASPHTSSGRTPPAWAGPTARPVRSSRPSSCPSWPVSSLGRPNGPGSTTTGPRTRSRSTPCLRPPTGG
jgi:hypothetical protein